MSQNLKQLLDEALKRKGFGYTSINPNYILSDLDPDVLVLDPDYPPEKKDGILAFNLHYLDTLDSKELKKFIKDVQTLDDDVVDLEGIKKFIKKALNVGHYPKDKDTKIMRYEALVANFPILKRIIRHYKKKNIA